MRENEFEKQVQKLMDDFQLSPSPSVWERVQSRILQRRRKWPLVALLLISMLGTGYLIYNQFGKKQAKIVHTEVNNTAKKTQGKSSEDQSSKQDNTTLQQPDYNTKNNIIQKENANDIDISLKKSLKNNPLSEPLYQKDIPEAENLSSAEILPTNNLQKNNLEKEIVPANQQGMNDCTAITEVTTNSESAIMNQVDTTARAISAGASEGQATPVEKKSNVFATKKNPGKLSFGITAYAGRSNTVENLFGIGSSKNMPGNSINDSLGFATNHPEKPFSSSFSYKAEVFVQKNISLKNSVSVGINYMYFSTKAKVTNANSSLILAVPGPTGLEYINSYYRPAARGSNMLVNEHIFTGLNEYSFAGLDVQFHQSLLSSKKTGLYADAGLSAMRLLSANTLIYDNKTNTYYYRNDWLAKWQASFNAALSLHIKINRNNYLFVGPEMSYGFTNLLNNKNYAAQHLLSYGLKAGWVIGRK